MDWALIVLTFVVVRRIDSALFYALAIIPLGSRQQGLGALFHDAAHRLASRNRRWNDLVGNLLGAWPLGLTLEGYRRYHFAHHRLLGTEQDPENLHKRSLPQWQLPASPLWVAASFAGDLLGGGVPHLAAAGKLTRPGSIRGSAGLVLFWGAVFLIAWRLHLLWVPILWMASIVTVFWSGVRLRIWTEHLGSVDTHRIVVPWWLAHLIMPHNIGLHYEHHHFPAVPFWALPRLRARLLPGTAGAAPLVGLAALLRGFLVSAPLGSGQVGVTVGPGAPPAIDPVTVASRTRQLRVLSVVVHVVLPLFLGLFVYLTCRRVLPHAFAWFPLPGLLAAYVPARLVNVFPDVVWAYALTALQVLIWRDDLRRVRWFWIATAPLCAAGWELGQAAHVFPGTFDWGDLIFSLMACALAVLLLHAGRILPLVPAADPIPKGT